MNKLCSDLRARLPVLTLVLFVLQPLMDVLSFWLLRLKLSTLPTLALRLLVLAAVVLAGFVLERRKRIYWVAGGVCLALGLCHAVACFQFGYQDPVGDVSNYVRVLQLPLMTIALMTFLRANRRCYGAMRTGLAIDLALILVIQVLALATGTEPRTYFDGTGYLGWFSNTNTQSSILTMIAPVAVVWGYERGGLRSIRFWGLFAGACLSMYFMGPRLTYAGVLALCFGLGVSMVIVRLRDWKRAALFFLAGVLVLALVPFSPMVKHRNYYNDHMNEKQEWIDQDLQGPPVSFDKPADDLPEEYPAPLLPGEPLELTVEQKARVEELAPVYWHYVRDFVVIFGVERTVHMYGYTDDIRVLSATRQKKLMFAEALMDLSPVSARLFGVELSRFTVNGSIYDVENDFHGIYYLYGAVGLAALGLFLLWFLWIILRALLRDFRRYFTLEAAGWGIALVMGLAHCGFTAGVLRRPSASFYLAAVLAGVYYLVKVNDHVEKTIDEVDKP